MRSASRDASMRELREREAQAREAARRRIGIANAAVERLEARFRREVARLDDATRRLPDLDLRAPRLRGIAAEYARDPSRIETYAVSMEAVVDRFCRELDTAIVRSEQLLRRRLRRAEVWQSAKDIEEHLQQLVHRCTTDARRLREQPPTMGMPARPSDAAELEEVENHLTTLHRLWAEWEPQASSLHCRVAASENARRLGGEGARSSSADEALAAHDAAQRRFRVSALENHLQQLLQANDLEREELPEGLQARLALALEDSHARDHRADVTLWIERYKRRQSDASRALVLMQAAPEGATADPALAARWLALNSQLQRVASGLDELAPSLEHEYAQLGADAQRSVNAAFSRADWVRALHAEGFEVLEREDGEGLIVVDLGHPQTWLEAVPYESEDGGFLASLELKTDAVAMADEAGVTDSICAKLARVGASATSRVTAAVEVVERETRITRAQRPKACAKPL